MNAWKLPTFPPRTHLDQKSIDIDSHNHRSSVTNISVGNQDDVSRTSRDINGIVLDAVQILPSTPGICCSLCSRPQLQVAPPLQPITTLYYSTLPGKAIYHQETFLITPHNIPLVLCLHARVLCSQGSTFLNQLWNKFCFLFAAAVAVGSPITMPSGNVRTLELPIKGFLFLSPIYLITHTTSVY